jgi:hypothetical protein
MIKAPHTGLSIAAQCHLLSKTVNVGFCVMALKEALARFGLLRSSTRTRAARLPASPHGIDALMCQQQRDETVHKHIARSTTNDRFAKS